MSLELNEIEKSLSNNANSYQITVDKMLDYVHIYTTIVSLKPPNKIRRDVTWKHITLFVKDLFYQFILEIITARKRSLGQGNIFRSMCQEFCSRGEGLPQCMLGYHPPPEQSMLGDTVNERAVRILLECILVIIVIINVLN